MKPMSQLITNWALGIAAGIAVLFLNAYLEHQHSETETQFLTELAVVDAVAAEEAER